MEKSFLLHLDCMKPLKTYLSIFLLCFVALSYGQNSIRVTGVVKNDSNTPITDVLVFISTNSEKINKTNDLGFYELKVNTKSTGSIVFKHVGYEQQKVELTNKLLKQVQNGVLLIDITLKDRMLDEFVIGGKKKPKVVYQDDNSSVSDFVFVDDKLLVLSYTKSLKKDPVLRLLDQNQELITEYEAPKKAIKFYTDYKNDNYLITARSVYLITLFREEVRLRKVDKEEFYNQTCKIMDTINEHYLFCDFSTRYPAFSYYYQSLYNQEHHPLHKVEDKFMMDLYRAEYKYASGREKMEALQQEINTGVDKEIWIGAAKFTQSPYYKVLYAPLFVKNDTILIFDHYQDHLYRFDNTFNPIDSLPIRHHKSKQDKNWQQPIIKDQTEKDLYALFKSGGRHYLKFIETSTGKTKFAFKLYYRFTKNIKIKNGHAYYIYRPFESSQRKYLYKEKITRD